MKDLSKFLMRGLLHGYYWCDEGLQNSLRIAGFPTLSRTKSMIMVNIADGITRPSALVRNIGISRQAIQQTLAELEEDGLVRLRPDPTDGRAKIVEFSPQGKDIGKAAYLAMDQMETALKKRVGAQRVEQMRELLFEDWGSVYNQDATEEGVGLGRRQARRRKG